MRRLFVILVLDIALAGALRAETIERVVAKVNGQIITLSEFQNRQIAAAQGARVDPAGVGQFLRQNNARLLQEAIDEILIMQKAEDAGIHAPSAWIDFCSSSARSRFELKPAATTAPSAARPWQIAAPMPRVPPVTSATRPVRSLSRFAP